MIVPSLRGLHVIESERNKSTGNCKGKAKGQKNQNAFVQNDRGGVSTLIEYYYI
jgi:hypothetical protein